MVVIHIVDFSCDASSQVVLEEPNKLMLIFLIHDVVALVRLG